jgi:spore germination protein YaaH
VAYLRLRRGHGRTATSAVIVGLFTLSLIVPNTNFLFPAERVAAAPIVRWGYYVTYAKDSLTALQANAGALNIVSPAYFTLKADGTIVSTEEPDTNAFLRAQKVKILPLVKNEAHNADFTPMIATPDAREKVAQTIADLVVQRPYDGINVDFEDVRPEDRPLLTDTMARISAKVRPSGKLVTQAVVGKAEDKSTGYAAAFDYPALAPSVDYALIMAYDYHYAGGDAGAVAPINWVRDVAAYASSTFGAGKVLLGVPLYGYDWDTTSGDVAKAVTYKQAVERSQRPGATRTLDLATQSEVVRYTDDDGDQHQVWFESAATFDAKFALVRQMGLAGFGLWRIGQEDSGVWDVMRRGDQPTSRAPKLGDDNDNRRYFSETGHTIQNGFKAYFDANGGVSRFGFPLTDEFQERNLADDRTYTVQYFERARFEWHPETSSVALGKIGLERFNAIGKPNGTPLDKPATLTPDKHYFPETRHILAGSFKQYWDTMNGQTYLGLPISEEVAERGADGVTRTVQYFENGRLEYNPNGTTLQERVSVGLVGTELLRARGWVP